MIDRFFALFDAVAARLRGDESLRLSLAGEDSDFVRFNEGRVRQAGAVSHHRVTMALRGGSPAREAAATFPAGGEADAETAAALLGALRERLAVLPGDPLLPPAPAPSATEDHGPPLDFAPADAVAALCGRVAGEDAVGAWASGRQVRAVADSGGTRRAWSRHSWSLDLSLVAEDERAARVSLRGGAFDARALDAALDASRARRAALQAPLVPVGPGPVRAWLAPAAVADLLALIGPGFGAGAVRAGTSALHGLHQGTQAFDPAVCWEEAPARLGAPPFSAEGHARPAVVPLVVAGRPAGVLVPARAGVEHGLPGTGTDEDALPVGLSMAAGALDDGDLPRLVGDGLLIHHLWYLNWSGRAQGRFTGLTRAAAFVVRGGRVVGPAPVLRVDDTLEQVFGAGFLGAGRTAVVLPRTDTYLGRSVRAVEAPGVLVEGLRVVG